MVIFYVDNRLATQDTHAFMHIRQAYQRTTLDEKDLAYSGRIESWIEKCQKSSAFVNGEKRFPSSSHKERSLPQVYL